METKSTTTKSVPDAKNEIVIDRVFDLPVSKVWKAWTESEALKNGGDPKILLVHQVPSI